MKKITRTIIVHRITLATVGQNMQLEEFETREVASMIGSRELAKMSKEMGKQVVIAMDVPIERKYSMTTDVFIEHATLENVSDSFDSLNDVTNYIKNFPSYTTVK